LSNISHLTMMEDIPLCSRVYYKDNDSLYNREQM
jgi:hypothetical protein